MNCEQSYNPEMLIIADSNDEEYFCKGCGQFRLNLTRLKTTKCQHCGSTDLIVGKAGTLDIDQIRKERKTK